MRMGYRFCLIWLLFGFGILHGQSKKMKLQSSNQTMSKPLNSSVFGEYEFIAKDE
jgi:hypothetical protein